MEIEIKIPKRETEKVAAGIEALLKTYQNVNNQNLVPMMREVNNLLYETLNAAFDEGVAFGRQHPKIRKAPPR
jgi:hypothetical protein